MSLDICDQQGATETAIEWCEKAITFTGQTDHEEKRTDFEARRADLVESAD